MLLFCDKELLFVPDLSINFKTFHFPLCYSPAKPSRVFQEVFLTLGYTTNHRTLHFYQQIFKPVSRIVLRMIFNFIIFFTKNRCRWCSRHLKCMSLNNSAYCIIIIFLLSVNLWLFKWLMHSLAFWQQFEGESELELLVKKKKKLWYFLR